MIPTSSLPTLSLPFRWHGAGRFITGDILPALALLGGTLLVLMLTGLITP